MVLPQNIMIVEDEVITQRYLKDILSQNSINVVDCFNNGEDALESLNQNTCDMILMDINIKGAMDGLRLSKRILDRYSIPIVYITAHTDQVTFSEVLELSPYGFVSKPFSPRELEISIKVAYQRFLAYRKTSMEKPEETQYEDIRINDILIYVPIDSKLYHDGTTVKLSKMQMRIIDLLAKNLNHVFSNEDIKVAVWGEDKVSDTSLRTLIYSLRKMIPDLPLKSYNKSGYCMVSNK